jgi:hypothetical protein
LLRFAAGHISGALRDQHEDLAVTEAAPRAKETGLALAARLSTALPYLLFIALAVFNSVRLFRHPMWSDEMQDFLLAAGSSSPLDLFLKLKYEGHAGLWHLLLWVVTRFTSDPVWMQALHLAIALGIWVLIWRLAPFGKLEKLLLLLSYFLFFEYFVVSRTYAIGVLLGFAVIVLRMQRPDLRIWPGLLLGLLANTSIFGAIWALGMALFMGLENRGEWRSRLPGTALFVALMAFTIWTMAPSPDNQFVQYAPSLKSVSLEEPLRFAVGAFLPLFWPFTFITLKSLGGWAADLAGTPFGPHPFQSAVQAIEGAGLVPVLLVLALPVLAVWSVVRERMATLEFATIYAGILLFAQLSQYPFTPRHFGFVFVAFVGVVWMARRKAALAWPALVVWLSLLSINAAGGLASLADTQWPFSQSRNVADWLERNKLDGALVMAQPDYAASAIAGYWRRPLYYLNCECYGTYVEWKYSKRDHGLREKEIVARVARAMSREGKREAYLIVNIRAPLERQDYDTDLSFERVAEFRPSIIPTENYVVYRVTRRGG